MKDTGLPQRGQTGFSDSLDFSQGFGSLGFKLPSTLNPHEPQLSHLHVVLLLGHCLLLLLFRASEASDQDEYMSISRATDLVVMLATLTHQHYNHITCAIKKRG
jgi:hypothetical protein